ncbi:hypothetical protein F3Y22_tig00116951pilonHSYRG00998 [Hibiscus syriacus]|uniref:Uncharacterized protein n=1 Tax=Hibiscus syriacus TaxID=106335 RepID=A0A6A2WLS2_HIBSY|nr:hypothetical protein F3Y22_tig00116951pilonHSYRG00998 [Hibiscus syriacus]
MKRFSMLPVRFLDLGFLGTNWGFVDFDLESHVEVNADSWYEICKKMRLFYDLGCEKGKLGNLMGRCRFVDSSKPPDFGFRFGNPSDFGYGNMKHFGLSAEKRDTIAKEYPYVLGRNKMANLPNVMRALNLHEWFFDRIKDGNHGCLLIAPSDWVWRKFFDMKVLVHVHGTSTSCKKDLTVLSAWGLHSRNFKRIKPRYRCHKWLMDNGLCTRNYSIASIVATGEKSFVARLSRIHPDAPKYWLESFSYQEPGDSS